MLGPIYAGDSMVGRGRVIDKRREESRLVVDLEITVFNQRAETCCPAEVTLDLSAEIAFHAGKYEKPPR